MNCAYKLILIVFLLKLPMGAFGCETEKAPEKVEQQTDQEEDNALAKLNLERQRKNEAGDLKQQVKGSINASESQRYTGKKFPIFRTGNSKKSWFITEVKIRINNLAFGG